MAFTILAVTVLVVVVTICVVKLVRTVKEHKCDHNFRQVNSNFDVTFGRTTSHLCQNVAESSSTCSVNG